jgi:hypothetical protein
MLRKKQKKNLKKGNEGIEILRDKETAKKSLRGEIENRAKKVKKRKDKERRR